MKVYCSSCVSNMDLKIVRLDEVDVIFALCVPCNVKVRIEM